MDIRRITLALFVAFLVALGATYVTYSKIRNIRTATPTSVPVVVAATNLNPGAPLTRDGLKVVAWPAGLPIAGTASKIEDVVGRALIYPLYVNQPLVASYLAEPGSGIGLSAKIPDGMRATSIRSNDVTGVAGFLFPGSHVDVELTYRPDPAAQPQTETILQDVTVLTAGQTTEPDPKGKPEPVNVVTLLVTPEDSQKLVLASQEGTVQFVLRNGADQAHVATTAAQMSAMGGLQSKPVAKSLLSEKKHTATVKPSNVFTVETIAGDKHTIDKF
ncbi:MAG: Flp pilus assembly protein CpaB [Acidobacteriota bacterium]|nr:Flp pilus assembly protein CpaB [Acidobacteriota bacterium]